MIESIGFDDADVDEYTVSSNLLSSIKLAEVGSFLSNGSVVRCELYENERYAPFVGFSAQNLLPTDRRAISTEDGLIRLLLRHCNQLAHCARLKFIALFRLVSQIAPPPTLICYCQVFTWIALFHRVDVKFLIYKDRHQS